MKNILFIHQSADLYGSDKTLLVLVKAFKQSGLNPIVVLPESGPLHTALTEYGIEVWTMPVVKISRKMFALKNLIRLPFQIFSSLRKLNKIAKSVDLVYSNTLAVLLGFLFAKLKNKKHIWHIHEIIEHPPLVTGIFKKLIHSATNTAVIFNSNATKTFWEGQLKSNAIHSFCVWNGLDKPSTSSTPAAIQQLRANYFRAEEEDIVLALVGRINRLKGHQLLLAAFEDLIQQYNNIKLVFVGSPPPNQEEYQSDLIEKINAKGLNGKVCILPFHQNIWEIWESIDIAVVPSTEPESFGLVAIEAMLCKKPVIASDFGGLMEIVVDGETGLLFEPSSQAALKYALQNLIENRQLSREFGVNGYNRAIKIFTLKEYTQKIKSICEQILKNAG